MTGGQEARDEQTLSGDEEGKEKLRNRSIRNLEMGKA